MSRTEAGVGRRPIRRLPPATVEKIAAGEVVERPASVVKELIDNSVDAGASEVRVHVEGGGLSLVRVDDDGLGIPAEELALAVEPHATSKIASAEELDAIATLGFRGEALAAIGSVSHLTITSRVRGSDEAHVYRVVGGVPAPGTVTGRPPGTTVEVRELFFNTPARRKFLRSPAAEQLEVTDVVERFHVARPSVGLLLTNESGEMGRFPRTASLRDALARVIGPEVLLQSFDVDGPLPGGGEFTGRVGRPAVSRSNSLGLYVSVNGRPVQSRPIAQAVRAAFVDYLPRTRFPVGALSLTIPPGRVDVNVHPTKREVRLADERPIVEAIRVAVRAALREAPHVAGAPAAWSPPHPMVPTASSAPAPTPRAGGPATATGMRPARQRALVETPSVPTVPGTARHPSLRLLGVVFSLYWAAESPDGMTLIDQHAASERVLFEELLASGRLARQELLAPVTIELTARQRASLDAHRDDVDLAGFEVESFGGDRVRVRSVPACLGRRARVEALPSLLEELASGGRPTLPDGLKERTAASVACHAAVRAGDTIEPAELQRILTKLFDLPGPSYACPHGRPILIELPRGRLDRWFLRAGE